MISLKDNVIQLTYQVEEVIENYRIQIAMLNTELFSLENFLLQLRGKPKAKEKKEK